MAGALKYYYHDEKRAVGRGAATTPKILVRENM